MSATKNARSASELMHTMGGRPAVKDSLEHMGLDVGEKGGGGEFHKEIGPVEVDEGGGGSPKILMALSSKFRLVKSCWVQGSKAL